MGRSFTTKYRLELFEIRPSDHHLITTKMCWQCKEKGLATADNLVKYITALINSFKIGGVNEHVSNGIGYMPIPNEARIVNQRTGAIVAEWKAPKFMII